MHRGARTRLFRATIVAALVIAAVAAPSAWATDYLVNTDADDLVDGQANCEASEAGCTLRGAILAGNDGTGPHTITFDDGVMSFYAIALDGTALPAITQSVTIDALSLAGAAIDGTSAGSADGLTLNNVDATLTVSALQVHAFSGDGIVAQAGTLNVQDFADVFDNGGDGVLVNSGGNPATIDTSTISENGGDGIETSNTGTTTVTDSVISGNGTSTDDAGVNIAGGSGHKVLSNTIESDGGPGVFVADGSIENEIRFNSFNAHGGLPIELQPPGGNQLTQAPTTSSPSPETLKVDLVGGEQFTVHDIDIFSHPSCAAGDLDEADFIGALEDAITLDVNGDGSTTFDTGGAGFFSATATDSLFNTSQLGNCVAVAGPPPPPLPPQTPSFDLAQALFGDPIVTGASYVTTPPGVPGGGPVAAVMGNPLNGFPTSGGTFAALTNGDAPALGNGGGSAGGGPVRGDTDKDVTILKVDVNVPAAGNCLQLDLRFLTQEFPAFVGGQFNDGFIAELDSSTWSTAGSAINAPNNFAFDDAGRVLSVNAAGAATVAAQFAGGTGYGGATKLLRASTPVTPGPHSVFLSIFDQGDDVVDSAAYVDNLVARTIPPAQCIPGVVDAGAPLQGQLDPPTRGETANAEPRAGTVFFKPPAGAAARPRYRWMRQLEARGAGIDVPRGFLPLTGPQQIPIGSTLDTRQGTVGLTLARDRGGSSTQTGDFSRGMFGLRQSRGGALTTLVMRGGGLNRCRTRRPKGGARKVQVHAARRSRRLFGNARGRFRTRGRNSAATVRGTRWLQKDTCAGTLTIVRQGSVVVRDFGKGRNVVVERGERYLARAKPKRRQRR
jgi:hypothetical protein